jgi:hypothetical protein
MFFRQKPCPAIAPPAFPLAVCWTGRQPTPSHSAKAGKNFGNSASSDRDVPEHPADRKIKPHAVHDTARLNRRYLCEMPSCCLMTRTTGRAIPGNQRAAHPWVVNLLHSSNNSCMLFGHLRGLGYKQRSFSERGNFTGSRRCQATVCAEAGNGFAAGDKSDWPWGCSQKRMKMEIFMNIRILLALFVALGAGFMPVRAGDNPAQAAARAALEQKLSQPDAWEPQSLKPLTTPSVTVVEQPVKSATNMTGAVAEKSATPQTAPVVTAPAPAPAAEAPVAVAAAAVVAPTVASPASVSPVSATPVAFAQSPAPAGSFPILSVLLLSLLLLSLLLISLLLLKLRQVKLLLLKHPHVAARAVAPPTVMARAVVASAAPAPAVVTPAVATSRIVQPVAAAPKPKPAAAPAAIKRPVQRRKRIPQQNGTEGEVNLPKIEWAKTERKRSHGNGSSAAL